ncbi:mycothiol transferase [Nocardioides acrostichi]|uniref:DUF664 domain-containing protein n=1 Tax=Nocardioides acrostichi TaxID=2784339 RepID=A0A930UUG4_9ACTN|nr:DinB family protein [Nocardioides acrostichi]MBF4161058.1 DUF664 domain-containing protein [Nocardioides acrostichi]
MDTTALLDDCFDRAQQAALAALDDLGVDALAWRPDAEANPVGWLAWHLARVVDDHVADVAGHEQLYTAEGFTRRFGLPFDDAAIGYGHSSDEVAAVRADAALLAEYLSAVYERARSWLPHLTPDELDRVVDERWDPPVTLGVRLVSLADEGSAHAGQMAYVRGLWERRVSA